MSTCVRMYVYIFLYMYILQRERGSHIHILAHDFTHARSVMHASHAHAVSLLPLFSLCLPVDPPPLGLPTSSVYKDAVTAKTLHKVFFVVSHVHSHNRLHHFSIYTRKFAETNFSEFLSAGRAQERRVRGGNEGCYWFWRARGGAWCGARRT